jgi:hypothetical protein
LESDSIQGPTLDDINSDGYGNSNIKDGVNKVGGIFDEDFNENHIEIQNQDSKIVEDYDEQGDDNEDDEDDEEDEDDEGDKGDEDEDGEDNNNFNYVDDDGVFNIASLSKRNKKNGHLNGEKENGQSNTSSDCVAVDDWIQFKVQSSNSRLALLQCKLLFHSLVTAAAENKLDDQMYDFLSSFSTTMKRVMNVENKLSANAMQDVKSLMDNTSQQMQPQPIQSMYQHQPQIQQQSLQPNNQQHRQQNQHQKQQQQRKYNQNSQQQQQCNQNQRPLHHQYHQPQQQKSNRNQNQNQNQNQNRQGQQKQKHQHKQSQQ